MRDRLFDMTCGILILAGSILFLNGGRQHPGTGSALGTLGSESYFQQFAHHINAEPHWEGMHAQILAGPILWVLGCAGLRRRVRPEQRGWSDLALLSLTIGTGAWILAFIFDGFVAPMVARAVAERASAESFLLLELRANQLVVIRAGLVGWILIGGGIAALGISMLTRARPLSMLLGLLGIVIGLWPVAAWLGGPFEPGPFVSALWRPTAVVTAVWFVTAGGSLFGRPTAVAPSPSKT